MTTMPTNTACCEKCKAPKASMIGSLLVPSVSNGCLNPSCSCHASPSKPPSIIDKEIDRWLTTSRSIDQSEKEANLRAALTRVYEAGCQHILQSEYVYIECYEEGMNIGRAAMLEEVRIKAEGMPSRYPEDIFPKPWKGWEKDIDELAKSKGKRIDNISAVYGRMCEDIIKADLMAAITK